MVDTLASESGAAQAASAARLLALVAEIARELHPERPSLVNLDSRLSEDVALDSLARMELLGRIERTFGVALPEHTISAADTPRDLLRGIEAATASNAPPLLELHLRDIAAAAPEVTGEPQRARTLIDVLDWHVAVHPERQHIRFIAGDDQIETLSYAQLRRGAEEIAGGLRRRGLQRGQTVALMLPTSIEFFFVFMGVLLAGGVPVPIYPPARRTQIEEHLRRHAAILANAEAVLLVTVAEAQTAARFLRAHAPSLSAAVTPAELRQPLTGAVWSAGQADDLAFLQYTSGSTGSPKGVMLTHKNLLANIRAMAEPFKIERGRDVFVSWLPLYHDMGLIGAWMGSLYHQLPLVLMSPLRFLTRPERWLWAIHEHRGTLSAAPNFAYELCRTRIKDSDIKGLDLSSWRIAGNGAEAVLPGTLRGFQERFSRYGLRPTAQRPVYGLAENSVGLSFPPTEREPRIDRIRRDVFTRTGVAEPAAADDGNALEFVACGVPIPGHEVRVIDPSGREVEQRLEGAIEFRGPSATQGYFHNPEATRVLFDGDWLRTGDLGYIANGELHITGREKDIVIRAGRNLHAPEIEAAAGEVDGIRKGCVAVFGTRRGDSGTEHLVVMAETRETNPAALYRLRDAVSHSVIALIGEPPDEVVLVPPHTVLKTSSGKVRRTATRDLFERGEHLRKPTPLWLQVLRLGVSSVNADIRHWSSRVGEYLYAAWWWLILGISTAVVWPVVSLIPSPAFGRPVARAGARVFLNLVGARPQVVHGERLGRVGAAVIIANHTSYLDGMVLMAALDRAWFFVAKNTLRRSPWSRSFLQHIGARFVERFQPREGVADMGAIVPQIRAGQTALFFPEGTFGRRAGLLPFKMGAFLAAADADAPIVPVAIRGARTMLRGGTWFPRPSDLQVVVGEPQHPQGQGWDAAVQLRDSARAELLRHTGEADLRLEVGHVERLRPQAED